MLSSVTALLIILLWSMNTIKRISRPISKSLISNQCVCNAIAGAEDDGQTNFNMLGLQYFLFALVLNVDHIYIFFSQCWQLLTNETGKGAYIACSPKLLLEMGKINFLSHNRIITLWVGTPYSM